MRFQKLVWLTLCLALSQGLAAQVSVRAVALEEVLVDLVRRAPADVRPLNDATISAEVAAVVSVVHADVGEQVTEGELLLQLDPIDYELNLRQAEATLASAQARKLQADAKLKRAQELIENQYMSADELLERETDVVVGATEIQAGEVAVASARRSLEKCRIVAPFNGVVVERMAQVGAYVGKGNTLLRLTQLDDFELDAEIPADIAGSLPVANETWFESRGQRWPLELLRLSPVIETGRRTRRARFSFSEDAPAVGRSGEVVWHVERGLLPANLVSRRNDQLGVFLLEDGLAVFRPLPQAQEGRPVAVNGLVPQVQIITLGRDRLQDGDSVIVTP